MVPTPCLLSCVQQKLGSWWWTIDNTTWCANFCESPRRNSERSVVDSAGLFTVKFGWKTFPPGNSWTSHVASAVNSFVMRSTILFFDTENELKTTRSFRHTVFLSALWLSPKRPHPLSCSVVERHHSVEETPWWCQWPTGLHGAMATHQRPPPSVSCLGGLQAEGPCRGSARWWTP